LLLGRHVKAKERIRIGDVLIEGTRKYSIQYGSVAMSTGPLEKGVNRPSFVPRTVELEGGPDERP
jgi:hypothetical protein